MSRSIEERWDLVIRPSNNLLSFQLPELWKYRDLLFMFVRRDIITIYKQTILGPIWLVVQPILTSLIYVLVFAQIASIPTDGIPSILFYLSGIVIWNFFSETFNSTANTFKENEAIFGKVYFPRILSPLSKVVSGLFKFSIQFGFLLLVLLYYMAINPAIQPNWYVLLIPFLVLIMALLGFSAGIIFTSLTTKYRDLVFLISFGVQLLMYATPVIYPLSSVPEKYRFIILCNPITPIVEAFRSAILGMGNFPWQHLAYSATFAILLCTVGILVFNKTERNFMDTI